MKRRELLVIEPSAEIRRALEDGLGMHGFPVTSVGSADEAVELLRSKTFHLLIGSAGPYDRSGSLGTVHEAFPSIPSIVVADDAFDPLVFGSDGYVGPRRRLLERPFTLRQLVSLVQRALAEDNQVDTPNAPEV